MRDLPVTAPADGLRAHSAALRSHAERLRRAAGDLRWQGPRADAFRAEVTTLADRCTTAAGGLDLAAAQLVGKPPGRSTRGAGKGAGRSPGRRPR
ncbi:hypothetical protein J7E97_10630 [Streptomyces sp. ISL-66]|uniref:hypothetical protein n=1 Tax=Streptomyces sp. ISL-66 TaxID=2819186 RepID=UPI001BEA6203|nr:hypothetical protein [Streptomyces sp. ISL-66]MBT2468320.1 hypothetical protein [Streptomyces sp. ISL-66]